MALLTLNGITGSDVCYWDISDLQSPFNTEHYIRAGIASIPIPFDSEWADIEAFVLDYTMAPTSNTQDNTNGSVVLDTAQTVYGFAQSSYGLCYQAGEAGEWPGMWPELNVTLTLTPTSKSIAALVQGLSYAHAYTRMFIWYVDGIQKLEQVVTPPITQHEYVITPVYFASAHKVKVQIYNATKTVLFFEDEKTTSTLYPAITPWSWSVGNGEATDAETSASFASLVSEGLVENFHWKVWNDFVNKVNETRIETGQAWKSAYATKAQALVAGIYSDLTVASFNSLVQNLDYPFWNWAHLPGSPGYLGRLLMRGTATMGNNADDVYYQYILELARKLNLVIGIYNNTGQLTPLETALNTALIIAASLAYSPPGALQVDHTIILFAEAQLLQRSPQALSAQLAAALISAGLLISRPISALSAAMSALLTQSSHLISRPTSIIPGLSSHIRFTTDAALVYSQMTFATASVGLILDMAALLGMNDQKVLLQIFGESTLTVAADIKDRPPAGITATMHALLVASMLVDTGTGHALQAGAQATLIASALLEMEAVVTWEYPVQTEDDLYITQVYEATQASTILSLE